MQRTQQMIDKASKGAKGPHGGGKVPESSIATYKKALTFLQNKIDIREGLWTDLDVPVVQELGLLSAKPIIYLVNMGKEDFLNGTQANGWIDKVNAWVNTHSPGSKVIFFSGEWESEVQIMDEGPERENFLKESKKESMMPTIITSGYEVLGLIKYFTTGEEEVRAWTIKKGSLAPQAGNCIEQSMDECMNVIVINNFHQ